MEIKPVKQYKKPAYAAAIAAAVAVSTLSGCQPQNNSSSVGTDILSSYPDTEPTIDGDIIIDTEPELEGEPVTLTEPTLEGVPPIPETDTLSLAGDVAAYPEEAELNEEGIVNAFYEKGIKMFLTMSSLHIDGTYLPISFESYNPNLIITLMCNSDDVRELTEKRAEKTAFGYIGSTEYNGESYTVIYAECTADKPMSDDEISQIISELESRKLI